MYLWRVQKPSFPDEKILLTLFLRILPKHCQAFFLPPMVSVVLNAKGPVFTSWLVKLPKIVFSLLITGLNLRDVQALCAFKHTEMLKDRWNKTKTTMIWTIYNALGFQYVPQCILVPASVFCSLVICGLRNVTSQFIDRAKVCIYKCIPDVLGQPVSNFTPNCGMLIVVTYDISNKSYYRKILPTHTCWSCISMVITQLLSHFCFGRRGTIYELGGGFLPDFGWLTRWNQERFIFSLALICTSSVICSPAKWKDTFWVKQKNMPGPDWKYLCEWWLCHSELQKDAAMLTQKV